MFDFSVGFKKKLRPAQLWRRVMAYLVDLIIVSFVIISPLKPILDLPKKGLAVMDYLRSSGNMSNFLLVSFIVSVMVVLYWAVFEFYFQQTIGASLFKLKVRSLNKKNPSFMQCLIRNLTKISTFVLLIDALYIVITGRNQRYLEMLSRTETVEEYYG